MGKCTNNYRRWKMKFNFWQFLIICLGLLTIIFSLNSCTHLPTKISDQKNSVIPIILYLDSKVKQEEAVTLIENTNKDLKKEYNCELKIIRIEKYNVGYYTYIEDILKELRTKMLKDGDGRYLGILLMNFTTGDFISTMVGGSVLGAYKSSTIVVKAKIPSVLVHEVLHYLERWGINENKN
jgi:hypothetical protein